MEDLITLLSWFAISNSNDDSPFPLKLDFIQDQQTGSIKVDEVETQLVIDFTERKIECAPWSEEVCSTQKSRDKE